MLDALGAARPTFAHVPLVVDAAGKKLSKRRGPAGAGPEEEPSEDGARGRRPRKHAYEGLGTVAELRAAGCTPLGLANYLASLGWAHETAAFDSLDDLAAAFDLGRVSRAASAHDPKRLAFVDAASAASPAGGAQAAEAVAAALARALPTARADAVNALADAGRREFAEDRLPAGRVADAVLDALAPDAAGAAAAVATERAAAAAVVAGGGAPFDGDDAAWAAYVDGQAAALGVKRGAFLKPLRLLLTGRPRGADVRAQLRIARAAADAGVAGAATAEDRLAAITRLLNGA